MHTRRLWPLVTILSVPAVAIFVVLVVAQAIDVLPALIAMAAMAGITALLLKPYIQDLEDVARFARGLPLDEEAGVPSLRTDIANDVLTALKLARRHFRSQSEELMGRLKFHETLFDSLPSPILLLDAQRRIVGENAAARKTFGRQQRDRDLAALLRHPDLLDAADKVLAGEAGGEVELTLTSPVTGEYRAMVEPLRRRWSRAAAAVRPWRGIRRSPDWSGSARPRRPPRRPAPCRRHPAGRDGATKPPGHGRAAGGRRFCGPPRSRRRCGAGRRAAGSGWAGCRTGFRGISAAPSTLPTGCGNGAGPASGRSGRHWRCRSAGWERRLLRPAAGRGRNARRPRDPEYRASAKAR